MLSGLLGGRPVAGPDPGDAVQAAHGGAGVRRTRRRRGERFPAGGHAAATGTPVPAVVLLALVVAGRHARAHRPNLRRRLGATRGLAVSPARSKLSRWASPTRGPPWARKSAGPASPCPGC